MMLRVLRLLFLYEVDRCDGVTCQNGGTPTASGDTCKCKCTAEWQGEDCSGMCFSFSYGIVKCKLSEMTECCLYPDVHGQYVN